MSYSQPTGCNCLCHGEDGAEGDGDPCERCNTFHEEADAMSTRDPTVHDSHVVGKNRYHGDRDGEITYYLVGPQRSTFEEAEDDLARFERAEEVEELEADNRALPEVLNELESERDESRARAEEMAGHLAALRVALEGADPEMNRWGWLPGALEVLERFAGSDLDEDPDATWEAHRELRSMYLNLKTALASGAGRAEAEVLRAALRAIESDSWFMINPESEILQCVFCWHCHETDRWLIPHAEDCPIGKFVAYRDALLAARGGEEEGCAE